MHEKSPGLPRKSIFNPTLLQRPLPSLAPFFNRLSTGSTQSGGSGRPSISTPVAARERVLDFNLDSRFGKAKHDLTSGPNTPVASGKKQVKESVKEPVEELVKELVKESVKEPGEESVKELVEESVKEPEKESVEELVKELVEEQVKQIAPERKPMEFEVTVS